MAKPGLLRSLAGALTCALILGCCSNSASIPSACPTDEILDTMNTYIPGSRFIDTPWEPAPDTDLAAAIDNGGVACSYGIQEAEVGATILWARAEPAFTDRRDTWQRDGQQRVEIDGVDEAWALIESNGTESQVWAINMRAKGAWIHISATFLPDLDTARALIDATVAVVR